MAEESIAKKSDSVGLLELQAKLAGSALALQERRTELILAITAGDLGQREPFALVTKALFTIRGIADGIAWRAFDCNRLVIRQLSQHPATGYLDADSFASELTAAHQWVERTGDVVITS